MKTKLFDDPNLTPKQILDNLEAENCGVEESHSFVRPFTEKELEKTEIDYLEKSKELSRLEVELKSKTDPIKVKMKPLQEQTKKMVLEMNLGGTQVTGIVYCFPDYESGTMGLYDDRGILVGTRPMNRAERQLHINSHLNKAV